MNYTATMGNAYFPYYTLCPIELTRVNIQSKLVIDDQTCTNALSEDFAIHSVTVSRSSRHYWSLLPMSPLTERDFMIYYHWVQLHLLYPNSAFGRKTLMHRAISSLKGSVRKSQVSDFAALMEDINQVCLSFSISVITSRWKLCSHVPISL